ncbi:MAG: hydantoinase B/oxoprolinase family protein [Acuticoccus sp.]
MQSIAPQTVSPVDLALFNSRLESITRRMANTMLRTGRSGVINTARDFSMSLVTARGELLSVSEGFPIHMLRGADLMAQTMAAMHPVLKRGDAFLHNSPYHGNSHAADHTIIVPVVDEAGVHRFSVLAKAHLSDCGNALPTTYMGGARDVYAEGALIFPATKIQENCEHIMDVVRMCQMRIRVPDQWWGDYLATLGAARVAEREILKLGAEHGWDHFHRLEEAWLDYSEERMVAAIGKLPAGRAQAHNAHDPFPGTPEAGIEICARVAVDPAAAMVEVDLRDNPDNLPCGLNLSEGTATSGALCGVFDSIEPGVPANAGSYRRIRVLLREGCVVGIPRHPTSCSVATTNLADRLVNAVQRAFAGLGEDIGMADAAGSSLPASCGVVSGIDPRTGQRFINVVILGAGGGPGTRCSDGWLTIACMGNAGMPFYDSIEVDELHHPLIVQRRALRCDSEGAGRFRGAPGADIEYGPVDCDIEVGFACDGVVFPAQGVRGGGPGATAEMTLHARDGTLTVLPGNTQTMVRDGESLRSLTAGGGGYGPAYERPAHKVAADVAEGWISPKRAREIYRVAVSEDGTVDEPATNALRF